MAAELVPWTADVALSGPISWEAWYEYGRRLSSFERHFRWLLGDWYLLGETRFGEAAAQAVEAVSLKTVQNAAWVAERFPPSRRRENLSWSHHAEVAGLEAAEADALLDRAESDGWSRARLRLVRREYQAIEAGRSSTVPACPRCRQPLICPACTSSCGLPPAGG